MEATGSGTNEFPHNVEFKQVSGYTIHTGFTPRVLGKV